MAERERKVLHVVPTFDLSGRSRMVHRLCCELEKDGVSCAIANLGDERGYQQNEIEVIDLAKKPKLDLFCAAKLGELSRKRGFSVIQSHGRGAFLYAAVAGLMGGARHVHTVHRSDGDLVSGNSLLRNILLPRASIVAVSEAAGRAFSDRNGFPLSRIVTIYNGIDAARYESCAVSDEKRAEVRGDGAFVIGTVARLSPDKDFDTLLKGFAEILKAEPGARLVVAGDGPSRDEIRAQVDALGLADKVRFLGFRNDVPEILSCLDLFVLSSHNEGMGIVLVEAMLSDVPVAASAVGGVCEIVEDRKDGLLFAHGDFMGLKNAALSIRRDDAMRGELVKVAHLRARERFGMEKMAQGYHAVYRGAARGTEGAQRKIMHIVDTLQTGGLESLVLEHCALVAKRGASRVSILSLQTENGMELQPRYSALQAFNRLHRGRKQRGFFELVSAMRRERPDVVHTHNFTAHVRGALAAKIAGVPIIVTTKHGRACRKLYGSMGLAAIAYRLADIVVPVSNDAHDVFLKRYGFPRERARVILNGIDTERFRPRAKTDDAGLGRDELLGFTGNPLVGAAARLVEYKGIRTLLESFEIVLRELPEAGLIIAGDGPDRQVFEELAAKLGIDSRTRFLGNRQDLDAVYPLMDIFVQPSYTEGIALTLLEAASCALPIVATRIGGNPEVIEDGVTGRLVAAKDAPEMAEAVIKLWKDKGGAERMGRAARENVVKRFSLERMTNDYLALYDELANNKLKYR